MFFIHEIVYIMKYTYVCFRHVWALGEYYNDGDISLRITCESMYLHETQ